MYVLCYVVSVVRTCGCVCVLCACCRRGGLEEEEEEDEDGDILWIVMRTGGLLLRC